MANSLIKMGTWDDVLLCLQYSTFKVHGDSNFIRQLNPGEISWI